MALFDALFGQFIDVIHWPGDGGDTLVWRFPRHNNEIKHGAKLTVREGQAAVFVHEGRLADVFPPGLYKLKTSNLPILSTLQHWDHGFESPFKSEVYFVSTRRFTDFKWGTRNPIMLRDPEFGPVRLRAFGTYAFRVTEPGVFLREIVGADRVFAAHEISDQLRNVIVARFSNAIATTRAPVLDLAANLDDLGSFLRERIAPEMAEYGVEVTKLLVENISLPPEVERALDRRTSMGVVGDLRRYAKFQAAEAVRAAADNPSGGLAAAGVGMGAGMGMGRVFQDMLSGPPPASPPPLPGGHAWHVALEGRAQGPFPTATVRELRAAGRIDDDALVWRDGLDGWSKLGDVAELAGGPSGPPPLPS